MLKQHFLIFIFIVLGLHSHAQLSEARIFQLDSITTNIPKGIRNNLDKVHHHLDSLGKTDEEKVWMFYGYIGTYFKYDKKRKKDNKALEYSPDFTTERASGVCRDFSKVFEVLCVKSKIPCMEVLGKTRTPIWDKINNLMHLKASLNWHKWNIVKYNDLWHLMDPTWTYITKVHKIKTYIPKKKIYIITQVKSVNRRYFNPSAEEMMNDHKPIHPAFFLSSKIPTYKTGLKRNKKKKIYTEKYDYAKKLDSIYSKQFPMFSKLFNDETEKYCKASFLRANYKYEINLPLLKTSKYNKPTIESYEEAKNHICELNNFIKDEFGYEFEKEYLEFFNEIHKRQDKLIKQREREKKLKKKSK